MSIFDLFRKKMSKGDFIVALLAFHKDISRKQFQQFKDIFLYKDEFDMLLAFKEIEYLVFWLLSHKLNETILTDIYNEFLDKNKLSYDTFREQLEIRYRIYDDAFKEFVNEPRKDNIAKHGIAIGQIVIKTIGNLDLLKNGFLKDGKSNDVAIVFKASSIWFEGIKLVDNIIEAAKRKFQIEAFLRDT